MSSSALPFFGPKCPSGSTWYACATGMNFVGCCASNPCATTCAQGNLFPASFNTTSYGLFPNAQCGELAKFYTCSFTSPPFMGCCKIGACTSGCSAANLAPAYLDNEGLRSAYGAVGGTSSTSSVRALSTSATRASSTFSTTTTSVAASVTGNAASAVAIKKDGPPVAAIAGGAAGGAFALAVVVGLLIYYCCHAKKSRKGHEEAVSRRQSDLPAMAAAHEKEKGMHSPEILPVYTSPNPNDYYGQHAGQYNQQYSQHQFAPEPQELPIEPHSPAFFSRKPVTNHQRNMSELSGDTAIRSELETPHGTPRVQSHIGSPLPSPDGQTHTEWQGPNSTHSGSNWVAHQNWQAQSGPEHAYESTHGLGLLGAGENAVHVPEHQSDANARGQRRI